MTAVARDTRTIDELAAAEPGGDSFVLVRAPSGRVHWCGPFETADALDLARRENERRADRGYEARVLPLAHAFAYAASAVVS